MYLTTMQSQMEEYIADAVSLLLLCSNDNTISSALNSSSSSSKVLFNASTQLDAYLKACPQSVYINKLIAFNLNGDMLQAVTLYPGRSSNLRSIAELPFYEEVSATDFELPYAVSLIKSIQGYQKVLAFLAPIRGLGSRPGNSFIYLESDIDMFCSVLQPYTKVNNVFLLGPNEEMLSEKPLALPDDFTTEGLVDGIFVFGGQRWMVDSVTLSAAGLSLYTCTPTDILNADASHILYIVIVVSVTGFLLAALLAVIVSMYLTQPIQRLNKRLKAITNNDFSFDPEIEKAHDEIGEMGHTVNEMTMSINHLLKETQEMYEQRKNIEISLLQSQVNPHFLYNTMDSIRWMAVIQKCPGIANTVCSLVNLLKHIAKGTQDKITLKEEMDLLNDYVAIQSVRYMETFTFVNNVSSDLWNARIIKLTLQPLVENAIFHGIEPMGECGTITLSAKKKTVISS